MIRLLSLFLFLLVFASCKTTLVNLYSKKFDRYKGEKFPEFSLVDTLGRPASLAAHRGKTVVVDMWFVGCGPCIGEFRESLAVKERFRKDPSIVFVNICFIPPVSREVWLNEIGRIHATGYNYYVPDSTYGRMKQYFNDKLTDGAPTVHLLDKEGRYLGWNVAQASESPMSEYMISKASEGVSAKRSCREFIRYFTKKKRENEEMNEWFAGHFGMEFEEYLMKVAAKDSAARNEAAGASAGR